MHNLKAVIFDLDGTIVDSKLDFDLMRQEIGIPDGEPILEFLETIDDENFLNKAHKIIHQHELLGANESTLIRDFFDFYKFLELNKIPTGLLTRNSKTVTEITLKKHKLNFDHVLTRDCCAPKPKPDGLHLINQNWQFPSDQIVYIGDYKFDLETAKNAQMIGALILNDKNKQFTSFADITFTQYEELKIYF